MTVQFDSVAIEWFANGTWYDLTPDIISDSRVRGTHGDMGTGLADRVSKKGTLSFQLNNSAGNSVRKEGYYTPTHSNVISPFWGRPYDYPLRVTFTYEGRNKVFRYTFEPGPDGVQVDGGIKGSRRVTVNFRDWIGLAQEYRLDLLASASSKRADEAMDLIIAAMNATRRPQKTLFRIGDSTFDAVFDDTNSGTSVYEELVKVTASEIGYTYNRADRMNGETLTMDNRNRRYNLAGAGSVTQPDTSSTDVLELEAGGNYTLESGEDYDLGLLTLIATAVSLSEADCGTYTLESGDDYTLESGADFHLHDTQSADFDEGDILEGRSFEVSHYDLAYQSARLSVQQKDVGTSEIVLFSMAKPLFIESGETLTGIRGRYRDPSGGQSYINGTDFVTPVEGTDYGAWANENGTGTDYKANISVTPSTGSAEVEFSITNSGPDAWVTNPKLQVRGYGMYPYDSLDIVLGDDNVSEKRLDLDMNYETDETVGRQYVTEIIKNPVGVTTLKKLPLHANKDTFNINAFMDLDIGSMINVSETMTNTDHNNPYFINGYEIELFKEAAEYRLSGRPTASHIHGYSFPHRRNYD